MKVVHFSTTDYGGAYRAAERISVCMKSVGIDSKVVVRTKTRQDTDCEEYFKRYPGRLISKIKNFANLLLSPGKLTTDMFGTDVSGSSYVREADIVVLHWVNSFISYKNVRNLVRTGKKIIWVMHDEWVYTEGYHCTFERDETPGIIKNILAKINIRLKIFSFAGKGITFVAVSSWLREQALKSRILKNETVITIHNPLDTEKFKSGDNSNAKYNDNGKAMVLFGADKATYNENKGFSFLIEALSELDGNKYHAVCFGNSPQNTRVRLENIDIVYTGIIDNDDELIRLYNAADVMVTPSIQESFGYTCLEALACGTPVTAFDTSGLRDQIIHMENGYLAKLRDSKDLLNGILYCIENKDRLSIKARERAVSLSSYQLIGRKYADLMKYELRQ